MCLSILYARLADCSTMSHILVKWMTEDKWDVYTIRVLKDGSIAAMLSGGPAFLDLLQGKAVKIE